MDKQIEAAFKELIRQCPQTDDLSESKGLPKYSLVMPYEGFDLRKIISAALEA